MTWAVEIWLADRLLKLVLLSRTIR